ncbi:MAG: TIR domain-containing protein [Kofleriaceae bacterium]
MARRVFFSFHFDNDIWRANQVRNSNVVHGPDAAGFFDHSEYEEAKKKSDDEIDRMIKARLKGTTVTIVLIGTETASRPWVKREIALSAAQKNGFLGIRIHHLKNEKGETSSAGPVPAVPAGVEFPVYSWDGEIEKFKKAIEAAGQRADAWRE